MTDKESLIAEDNLPEKTDYGLIQARSIHQEMSESYLDYAMSVIVARALPDVRDGLKPVHRRILYAMHRLGLGPTAKHRKSAKINGEVLGNYHPHGEMAVYDSMVRMAQWWSLRLPLVDGQGNFGCFTKDTEVLLTDGRSLSFADLVEENYQGKHNYTYTVNRLGLITVAEILNPCLTRFNAELVEVQLDNGARIRCTPDHRFMLKDGSFKEAEELYVGQSLMPIYQKPSSAEDRLSKKGYLLIYQNKTQTWVPAHHLADNYNLTIGRYSKSKGRVRHHLDFSKLNNNPSNVMRVGWGEHWEIHYKQASNQHKNEEYRQKIADGRTAFWSDQNNRKRFADRLSRLNLQNWQNPVYRIKMRRFLSDVNKEYIKNHPEKRLELAQRGSNTLKRLWKDPLYRQLFHDKIVASNKLRVTNLTGRSKFLNVCKAVLSDNRALNGELYEQKRTELYSYGGATKWATGINKYYNNDPNLILLALNRNHKVIAVRPLEEREDVYDLTINGSHNFALAGGIFVHNSMDGDSAAAPRYTEARLAPASDALLADIDKETVDFRDNYDGTTQEPIVLPTRLPNLLINGSQGIAVGMATNIPPHNVNEVIDGLVLMLEKPDVETDELLEIIKGPDFPTAGIAYGQNDIKGALSSGRGRTVVRGRAEIQEEKNRSRIIVSELPYQTNKSTFVSHIADLVKSKKIDGISDLRDESDRTQAVRVVVELKPGAMASKILNQLYELTELQSVVHYNMVSLIDGIQPRLLGVAEILSEFIAHRVVVVTRRTEYDLKIAQARAHILEGLKIALDHLDDIIKLIRAAKDRDEAKAELVKQFKLSEIQANAILDMRLSQLANLERQKIYDEYEAIMKLIADLEDILAKPERVQKIIKDELLETKAKYGTDRRTEIRPEALGQLTAIDLIPEESVLISLTRGNYVKRLPTDTYKSQQRGGKGVIGMATREDDAVVDIVFASTHDDIMFFTDAGRVFSIKAYEIPGASRQSKGVALPNLIRINAEEKVTALITMPDKDRVGFFFFATKFGVVKRVPAEAFKHVRKSGVVAIGLKPKDVLLWVKRTTGSDEIAQITRNGQVIVYNESQARAMGRSAAGVRGMRLKGDDEIIETTVLTTETEAICVISSNGIGKKVNVKEFRNQRRGGSGIRIAKLTSRTGLLVGGAVVTKRSRDLIIVSDSGQVIRIPILSVKRLSRQASGVILMRSSGTDKVVSMTVVDDDVEEAEVISRPISLEKNKL